jgi:ATP-dependent RNA circularization protein (DNA/RNA ligase family)
MNQKYPRTFHLPFSPGVQSDDKVIQDLSSFDNEEVVITEKMDGENTTIYFDHFHARSLDSPYNFTRAWIKRLQAGIGHDIPKGWRLCGENVSYVHSIEYRELESFFYLFSIWNEKNECLSWDDTIQWAELLDLAMPKTFYRGPFDLQKIKEIAKTLNTETIEGFTVRKTKSFAYDDFSKNLIKWVREGHVTTDEHWLKNTYPNQVLDPFHVKPSFLSQVKKLKP